MSVFGMNVPSTICPVSKCSFIVTNIALALRIDGLEAIDAMVISPIKVGLSGSSHHHNTV